MKNILLALMVVLSGCATTQIERARQSVTVGVGLFSGGVKALDALDAATQQDLVNKVHSGALSPASAQAQYQAFNVKYDAAVKAMTVLWDALQATANVAAAADAKLSSNIPAALTSLTQAIGEAVAALGTLNIKIPGVS